MIKSSIILPNMCLKHCFNLFLIDKALAARDEQLFWCIQLNSGWLFEIVMLLREGHAWFHIGYVNTRPLDGKLKSQPNLHDESSPFSW